MLQVIGLIVAVYALARLVQVPFEARRDSPAWENARLAFLFLVSGVGVVAVAILTVMLLNTPAPRFGPG